MDHKTCASSRGRRGHDSGSGKIWLYGSYTFNDSCGEVGSDSCPRDYKDVDISSLATYDGGHHSTAIPAATGRTHSCIKSGNHSGVSTAHSTSPDPGYNTNPSSLDTAGGIGNIGLWNMHDDNYTGICFKEHAGWQKTNPVDGTKYPTTNDSNWREHRDICCGLHKTKDSQKSGTTDLYCDTSYCHEENGHMQRYTKMSEQCSIELENTCAQWSWDSGRTDIIGFEDDMCAGGESQIAKFKTGSRQERVRVTDLDGAEEQLAMEISGKLTEEKWVEYGNRNCLAEDLLDNVSPDTTREGVKHEKCIGWCEDNQPTCLPKVKNTCERIYNTYLSDKDRYGFLINKYDFLCACNWPQGFYDGIKRFYRERYLASETQLSNNRQCLYAPCADAILKPLNNTLGPCTQSTEFLTCIQNNQLDFRGASIANTNIGMNTEMTCGIPGHVLSGQTEEEAAEAARIAAEEVERLEELIARIAALEAAAATGTGVAASEEELQEIELVTTTAEEALEEATTTALSAEQADASVQIPIGSIKATLRFDFDISLIEPGSDQRRLFISNFKQDIGTILGVDSSRIKVRSIESGSVIVMFAVFPDSSGGNISSDLVSSSFSFIVLPNLASQTELGISPDTSVTLPVSEVTVINTLEDPFKRETQTPVNPSGGGINLSLDLGELMEEDPTLLEEESNSKTTIIIIIIIILILIISVIALWK